MMTLKSKLFTEKIFRKATTCCISKQKGLKQAKG